MRKVDDRKVSKVIYFISELNACTKIHTLPPKIRFYLNDLNLIGA
jgi:hypothetical protein